MSITLDDYLGALSSDVRTVVDEVRRIVVEELPGVTEYGAVAVSTGCQC